MNMNHSLVFAWLTLVSAIPAVLFAGELTPDEQAFFDRHAADLVRFEAQTMDDLAIDQVFSTPFYNLDVILLLGDGDQNTSLIVTRIGDQLVNLDRPGTDGDLPEFQKLLNPAFKLRTDADAKMLQQALDVLYPIFMQSDKKARSFRHEGNTWIFARAEFDESKSGYIFTTAADGTIQSVKYQMRLP